jgi:hypothetical protein
MGRWLPTRILPLNDRFQYFQDIQQLTLYFRFRVGSCPLVISNIKGVLRTGEESTTNMVHF